MRKIDYNMVDLKKWISIEFWGFFAFTFPVLSQLPSQMHIKTITIALWDLAQRVPSEAFNQHEVMRTL